VPEYPLRCIRFKKFNSGLALGSVGFRIIEAVFEFAGAICLLLLLTLSQEFVKAGAPDLSYFQALLLILGSILNNVPLDHCRGHDLECFGYSSSLARNCSAVWLIIKGFNPSAIASLSDKVDMS